MLSHYKRNSQTLGTRNFTFVVPSILGKDSGTAQIECQERSSKSIFIFKTKGNLLPLIDCVYR